MKKKIDYNTRLRRAKNRLWKKISELVRRKYADENGLVKCFTCGTKKPWAELDAGHFIPAGNCAALRYDLRHIRPQETGCNRFKGGNPIIFRIELCKEIGEDAVKELEQVYLSHQTKKWNLSEIESLEEEIDLELAKL